MKRDWDVIREVLFEIEGLSRQDQYTFAYTADPNGSPEMLKKAEHVFLLHDAQYLNGFAAKYVDNTPWQFKQPSLTWAGHDLLETIRSDVVWNKIKSTARTKGIELTFDAVKALGKLALDWAIAN